MKPQGINPLLFRVTPLGYLETSGFAGWPYYPSTIGLVRDVSGTVSKEQTFFVLRGANKIS